MGQAEWEQGERETDEELHYICPDHPDGHVCWSWSDGRWERWCATCGLELADVPDAGHRRLDSAQDTVQVAPAPVSEQHSEHSSCDCCSYCQQGGNQPPVVSEQHDAGAERNVTRSTTQEGQAIWQNLERAASTPLYPELRDEVRRLRAEKKRLRRAWESAIKVCGTLRDEIDRLRAGAAHDREYIETLERGQAALEQGQARMRDQAGWATAHLGKVWAALTGGDENETLSPETVLDAATHAVERINELGAENDRLHRRLAEVEELTRQPPTFMGHLTEDERCAYCGRWVQPDRRQEHRPACEWLRVRSLVEGANDG